MTSLNPAEIKARAGTEADAVLKLWSLDGRRWIRRIAQAEQARRGLVQTGPR